MESRAESILRAALDDKKHRHCRDQLLALDKAYAQAEVRKLIAANSDYRKEFKNCYKTLAKKLAIELKQVSHALFVSISDEDLKYTSDKEEAKPNNTAQPYIDFESKICDLVLEEIFSVGTPIERLIIIEKWVRISQLSFELGDLNIAVTLATLLNTNRPIDRLKLEKFYSKHTTKFLKLAQENLTRNSLVCFLSGSRTDHVIPHYGMYKGLMISAKQTFAIESELEQVSTEFYDAWMKKLSSLSKDEVFLKIHAEKQQLETARFKLQKDLDQLKAQTQEASDEKTQELELQIGAVATQIEIIANNEASLREKFRGLVKPILCLLDVKIADEFQREYVSKIEPLIARIKEQQTVAKPYLDELLRLKYSLGRPTFMWSQLQKELLGGHLDEETLNATRARYDAKSRVNPTPQQLMEVTEFVASSHIRMINPKLTPSFAATEEAVILYKEKKSYVKKLSTLKSPQTRELNIFIDTIIALIADRDDATKILTALKERQNYFQKHFKNGLIKKMLGDLIRIQEKLIAIFIPISSQPLVDAVDKKPSSFIWGTLRKGSSIILFGNAAKIRTESTSAEATPTSATLPLRVVTREQTQSDTPKPSLLPSSSSINLFGKTQDSKKLDRTYSQEMERKVRSHNRKDPQHEKRDTKHSPTHRPGSPNQGRKSPHAQLRSSNDRVTSPRHRRPGGK